MDPYVFPGTSVLKNKLDIRDAAALAKYERLETQQQLRSLSVDVEISYEGYRSIHRHLFQNIYEWAGQSRTVDLAKGGTYFGPPHYVDQEIEKRIRMINAEVNLKGLDKQEFAVRAAEHICEINAIHPFREGNGRTQRAFLKVLGSRHAGHDIDLERIDKNLWNKASIAGFDGDYRLMAELIESISQG